MIVKLLTEDHLEFLSLKRGCRGSSELHLSKCQLLEISCRGSIVIVTIDLYNNEHTVSGVMTSLGSTP